MTSQDSSRYSPRSVEGSKSYSPSSHCLQHPAGRIDTNILASSCYDSPQPDGTPSLVEHLPAYLLVLWAPRWPLGNRRVSRVCIPALTLKEQVYVGFSESSHNCSSLQAPSWVLCLSLMGKFHLLLTTPHWNTSFHSALLHGGLSSTQLPQCSLLFICI